MNKMNTKSSVRGFTLLEIMVAIAIFAVVLSIALPSILRSRNRSADVICEETRGVIESAAASYRNDHPDADVPTVAQLVADGYIDGNPDCPQGGVYVWADKGDETHDPVLGCSIHIWQQTTAPTPVVGPLFESDFDSMDGLNTLMGKWSIHNGVLTPSKSLSQNRLSFGDGFWTDYQVSLNARLDKGSGFGVYYRADGRPDISGYCFQYDPGLGNKFVVREVYAGRESAPIQLAKMPADFDIYKTDHNVEINVTGNRHVIKIDGETIFEFDDDSFESGGAGLRSWNKSHVDFEDVSITPLQG